MAIISITITPEDGLRVQEAMDFENNDPPGTATAEDARQLLIQYLKDYTLLAERRKYAEDGIFTIIDPT